jgi:ribosomal protein L10
MKQARKLYNPNQKLTKEQVADIIKSPLKGVVLSKIHNVSAAQISKIRSKARSNANSN